MPELPNWTKLVFKWVSFFTEYFVLWEFYEHVCYFKSQMAYTDVEYKSRLNGRTEYHASADPTRGSAVVRCLIRCRSVSRWGTAKSFLVETRSCVRCGGAPSSPSLARIYPLWGFSPYWARAAWGTLVDLMSLLSMGINNTYRDRSWGGDYGVLYIDCHPLMRLCTARLERLWRLIGNFVFLLKRFGSKIVGPSIESKRNNCRKPWLRPSYRPVTERPAWWGTFIRRQVAAISPIHIRIASRWIDTLRYSILEKSWK